MESDSGSGPEVPYDVQLVAGNGAGCGKVSISQVFFTREGGTATYCLLCSSVRNIAK